MTDLRLDRMAIEEVGANPERLADAIHVQLGERPGPVPVAEIAKALDIVEIRAEPLSNIEGALVTTPERDIGSILVNQHSSRRRRRFTIGHELLHFLNAWHQPTFCNQADMIANQSDSKNRDIRQEAEANTFAIELLAPRKRLGPYLRGDPDLAAILSVSDEFDISREAAARRYVSCHDETLAAVFGHNGCFLYCDRSREFPWLSFRMGQRLPALPPGIGDSGVSVVDEAEASQWLSKSDSVSLTVQTLHQREGYSTTLLRTVAAPDDDEEEDADDVYERFTRFRGR